MFLQFTHFSFLLWYLDRKRLLKLNLHVGGCCHNPIFLNLYDFVSVGYVDLMAVIFIVNQNSLNLSLSLHSNCGFLF